jgi:Zn-dependent protease with chaperone function
MFAKPLKLILIYILTVVNIVFLIAPIIATIAPFINFTKNGISVDYSIAQKVAMATSILIFVISFLMLFFIFIDFLFGFSLRSSLKNCKRYEKIKGYEFLREIFIQTQEKFNCKSVKLYVKNSDEINAYAVSSMQSGAVVLTRGIIDHFLLSSRDPKEFLFSLRSIMAHEMSHLINRDFLPTFFVISNQKATNFISQLLHYFFYVQINFMQNIPYIGKIYSSSIYYLYRFINFTLTIFNKYVVLVIYNFLNKFASRSIEFRCDLQGAQAFGGENMVLALQKLGKSGYFTIFSTHPKTKTRINHVKFVKQTNEIILPRFIDKLTNQLAITILIIICLYFAKQANIDLLIRDIIRNQDFIYRKLSYLWHLLRQIY